MIENVLVPLINPNDPVAQVTHWYVRHGDPIQSGQALCDVTSTKITLTIDAPASGIAVRAFDVGARVRAGELLGVVADSQSEGEQAVRERRETAAPTGPSFTRRARALLAEKGLAPEAFAGRDFVTEADVMRTFKSAATLRKDAEVAVLEQAQRHALRSSVTVRAAGLKIDDRPYAMAALWACATARELTESPQFCSGKVDIGYAIDTGDGLRQFLASDCADWTREKWHETLANWSLKSMRNEIQAAELGRGTFALSDLTSFGVYQFEPLLVGFQSAILGIGGDAEAGDMIYSLTLSFDHRRHNGREAAEFLRRVRSRAKSLA